VFLIENAVIGQKVFGIEPVRQCEFPYGLYGDFGKEAVEEEWIIDMQRGRDLSGTDPAVMLGRLREFVVVPLKNLLTPHPPFSDIPVQSSTFGENGMLQSWVQSFFSY
jgi:hypothetical protein